MRWKDYLLDHGNSLARLWQIMLQDSSRRILYLLGAGFDPRTLAGLRMLMEADSAEAVTVGIVEFDEGLSSPSHKHRQDSQRNRDELDRLVPESRRSVLAEIPLQGTDGRRIGGRKVAEAFSQLDGLEEHTDIIIDVSALPRALYFPLVATILRRLEDGQIRTGDEGHHVNLHVFVAENPIIDTNIREVGVDETADYIHGFRGAVDREALALEGRPRVWIPLLGERSETQLDRIHQLVRPDEISPVLPSPARNPRRADDIVLEYQSLLFQSWRVEPRNVIQAHEQNPFEVYKQLVRTVRHYSDALRPLRGCSAVFSALSSKLMSVGALLAAYELGYEARENRYGAFDVSFAHIESSGHEMDDGARKAGGDTEIFGLWLHGECYET
jgi:hypothetical protein